LHHARRPTAIGIVELQLDLVSGSGLQIEDAAAQSIGPGDDRIGLLTRTRRNTPERHTYEPISRANSAIFHLASRIEIVIAFDAPFHGEIGDGWERRGYLAGRGGIGRGQGGQKRNGNSLVIKFRGAGHVAEHVIDHAAGCSAVGEAPRGIAGGVAMEIVPGLPSVRTAKDALAAIEGAGEHDVRLDGINIDWAGVETGEFDPRLAGIGAFEKFRGPLSFVAPVVLMLAVADEEGVLVLRMMSQTIDAIGGVRDLPGETAIVTGVKTGSLETLQIDMLTAGAGDKREAIRCLQRVVQVVPPSWLLKTPSW